MALGLLLNGCKGVQQPGERQARGQSGLRRPPVSGPKASARHCPRSRRTGRWASSSPLPCSINREIEAAYFDWAGSVENITVERSLPDPKLTFQAVHSRRPHLPDARLDAGFSRPGQTQGRRQRGRRRERAKYFAFEASVLRTAFAVKQAYYQLWFLDEKIRINRQTLDLLADLEKSARAQNRSRPRSPCRMSIARKSSRTRLTTEIANLEDSRLPLTAQFKGALGLTRDQPDPPCRPI